MLTVMQFFLRQTKYIFVVIVTLITREAIRGGLSEAEAYFLSDVYIQYMDNLKDPQEITNLLYTALFDFAKRVSKINNKNHSPIIKMQ